MIRVLETKSHPIASDETYLTFVGDDNKSYDACFNAPARAQLLALLQIDSARRLEKDLIPLTLAASTVAASAAGFALVIETMEAGPIALRVSGDQIGKLRETLAELGAYREPQGKM